MTEFGSKTIEMQSLCKN